MVEAYAIEASLIWKTNVPEILRQMLAGFADVNKAIADLKDNLRELTSSNRGIASLARQMEKLRLPTAALDEMRELGRVTGGLAESQRAMADAAKESALAWREMAEASRRVRMPRGPEGSPGALSRSPHGGGHVSAMDAMMGAQMSGDAGIDLFVRGYHAYGEVQGQQRMAQSDKKLSDAVMGRANALIATLQKQYPALTQAEGLTLFRNSMGIFGDAEESLKALPGAARLQMLYQLAPLGKGGTGGSEVQAAEKAGDIMQSFVNPKGGLDLGLYNKFMDFQARSYQAGGGLVDAKNWLSFARTSRTAGIGLNDRAMEEAQALLEISPGRTGTALNSAFQVFGATTAHMTNKNRDQWEKAGLIGKGGNIIDQQLYQADPFAWVWKDLVPHLKARGIQTRDQILRWLTTNGQRGTVSGLLADIAIGQTPITRTADKIERQNPNLVDKLAQTDLGKLAAMQAAETNFFVALGKFAEGPGVALVTNLANGLNTLADTMNAHPDASRRILEIGGGFALISKVVGDAGMAYLFVGSPLLQGLKGLATVAPAGLWVGLGAAAAALGAWAYAWEENKGPLEDMMERLKIGQQNKADADALRERVSHLSQKDRDWFNQRHPDVINPQPQATINLHVSGKALGKLLWNLETGSILGVGGVLSGQSGFDSSMSPTPAGRATGGGY